MPGGLARFGPTKENGLARSDQTGSVRMFSPAPWMRKVACPTKLTRSALPTTRDGGRSGGNGLGYVPGQSSSFPPSFQRAKSRKPRELAPPGLKNRSPSKWPLTGPR